MKFTTVALHKLKWVPRLEKYAERNFEFDPNAIPGCHLESCGLIPGPFCGNAEKFSVMAKNDPQTEMPKNF